MAAIDWITSVGAIPTVCVFRPLIGTDYENVPPPKTEDMVPIFRHLYEKCMEHGLPVGAAPDIHVSLVMLPEECRALSDKRYPMGEFKLKVLGKAVRYGLERRLKNREHKFGPPPRKVVAPVFADPGASASA